MSRGGSPTGKVCGDDEVGVFPKATTGLVREDCLDRGIRARLHAWVSVSGEGKEMVRCKGERNPRAFKVGGGKSR